MASDTTSPDLVDLQAQIRQLRTFSRTVAWTTTAFAVVGIAAGAYWRDLPIALTGGIVGLYSTCAWIGHFLLAKQKLQQALVWLSLGIVFGETSIAFVFPELGPTLALASLMPLILAMHYAETRLRKRLLAATALSTVSVILLWATRSSEFRIPLAFLGFYQVTSMFACLWLAAILCWPIRQWLNDRLRETMRARDRAELERARYEAFLGSQYDAVIATDAAGYVTLLNAAAEEATGWTFKEVNGRHIADSFCFETADASMGVEDFVARALSAEKGFLELKGVKLIARNHDKVWKVTVSAAPIMVGENVQGAIFTFRDLTKHLQSIERDQAAERMKVVERMAAGIAPEFDEACRSMDWLARRIGEKVEMDEMPDIVDVNELVRAGDKAAAMARQLLAIGQRQPGKPETIDFGEFIADIAEVLPRTLGRDICVIHQNEAGLGRIKADREQVRDAIYQVANYARDTMPVGGSLCLEASNVFLDVGSTSESQPDSGGAYVRLVIKDSGGGWSETDVQHLLEPFYEPAARTGGRAQSAFNLSVVHGLVRQNSGYLSVNSKLRVGSTYTMHFPRVDVDEWLLSMRSDGWPAAASGEDMPSGSIPVQRIHMHRESGSHPTEH